MQKQWEQASGCEKSKGAWINQGKRDMKWSVTTVDKRGTSRQDAQPMCYSVEKGEVIRRSREYVSMECSKDGMFMTLC